MGALAIAIQALQALVTLVPLGQQLKAQYDQIVASLQQMQAENRDPTQAEWDAVHKARADLEAQLNA
jgi:hypothetical protein